VPAVAVVADHSDAELLALGAQLEAVICDWIALRQSDQHRHEVYEAICEAAGLPWISAGDLLRDEHEEYYRKRQALILGPDSRGLASRGRGKNNLSVGMAAEAFAFTALMKIGRRIRAQHPRD
jgi:hypothetical protein